MNVAELFARIGIKTDEGKLKSFQTRLNATKTGMIAVTAAAAGISLAIGKIANDAMKTAVALKQFEAETGSSAQTLQEWQSVAEQTNQSAESVTAAIKSIAANQEKIKLGQGNISGFQLLGIDPQQDPFEILEQLRTKTAGMTDAMKKNILAQMGVGAGLIQTLNLSREQFDKMASRSFIISPKAIESLNKMKSGMDLARRGMNYMKTQIAVGLAPQINELTNQFVDFLKANEDGIVKAFKEGFQVVKIFTGAITNTVRIINNLVTSTIGWEKTMKGVLVVLGILNASLLASPMGIFIAGIILLVAVLDDLAVYSRGGKSLFGNMMEKFPELENMVLGAVDRFKELVELIKAFATGDDAKIDEILESWGIWGDIIQGIKTGLEAIIDIFNGGDFEMMTNAADEARASGQTGKANLLDFFGASMGSDRFYNAAPGVFKADWWKQVASGGGFGNITAEQARANNNITITVNGAGGSPNETAEAVKRELQRALNSSSAGRGRNE